MKYADKKALYDFVMSHAEDTAEYAEVKRIMNMEIGYADCETHSVCPDDLDSLSDDAKETLREKFNKSEGEDWTMDDCERVADALAEFICDEYSEDIYGAIEYEL